MLSRHPAISLSGLTSARREANVRISVERVAIESHCTHCLIFETACLISSGVDAHGLMSACYADDGCGQKPHTQCKKSWDIFPEPSVTSAPCSLEHHSKTSSLRCTLAATSDPTQNTETIRITLQFDHINTAPKPHAPTHKSLRFNVYATARTKPADKSGLSHRVCCNLRPVQQRNHRCFR